MFCSNLERHRVFEMRLRSKLHRWCRWPPGTFRRVGDVRGRGDLERSPCPRGVPVLDNGGAVEELLGASGGTGDLVFVTTCLSDCFPDLTAPALAANIRYDASAAANSSGSSSARDAKIPPGISVRIQAGTSLIRPVLRPSVPPSHGCASSRTESAGSGGGGSTGCTSSSSASPPPGAGGSGGAAPSRPGGRGPGGPGGAGLHRRGCLPMARSLSGAACCGAGLPGAACT